MKRIVIACGCFLTMAGLSVAPVHADVTIYSNLSENSQGAISLNDESVTTFGDSFTTGTSAAALTSVTLLLTNGGGTSGTFLVYLAADAGGASGPGGFLASLTGTVSDSSGLTSSLANYTFAPSSPITLAANTRYWVELAAGTGNDVAWSFAGSDAGTGVAGEYFNVGPSVSTNSFGPYQMEVLVSPVPEPGTLVLAGLVSALGGACVYRRKRGATAPR